MILFMLGFYLCGACWMFVVAMFFVALGGRNSDIWKPFVASIFWPCVLAGIAVSYARGLK